VRCGERAARVLACLRWRVELPSRSLRCAAQEDLSVIQLVRIHGPKKWSLIAEHLPGRIGKQCRERCV
jgi:hypothetical protein